MVSNCTYENKNKVPKASRAPSKRRMTKNNRKGPNAQITLLKFIHEVIETGQHFDKVIWMNKEKTSFQFINKKAFTVLYRVKFDYPEQIWDNIRRLLRFSRAEGLISDVPNFDSAFSLNYPLEDILEGRVVLNNKRISSTGKNAKTVAKEGLKIGTVGSITVPLSKPGQREATREEMKTIEKELLTSLVPLDAFLNANKKVKKLDFGQQIATYINNRLQSNSLPETQKLLTQYTQKAPTQH